MDSRLPVTLIGGFLGAGKTSLLHHIISGHEGGHLAVLVENPGALNLDAKAIRGLCGAMRRTSDTVLEIPNGEETAQVEWIGAQLRELALAGRHERVLIELAATTNGGRLARYFGLLPGQPKTFAPSAELQQVICVVDALDFSLTSKRPVALAPLWDFQQEQIAGASLVVLNKCDLVDDAQREEAAKLLRALNPEAQLVATAYGEMPPEIWSRPASVQDLGLATERRPPAKTGAPEMALASALYRTYRPFHPERFWDWFNADHAGLLRVKGLVWLATRNLLVGGVSRTRWQNACGTAGVWWAALPREDWPEDTDALQRMQETWREPYGDRRQELVLLGDAAQVSGITRQLNACLLNDEEFTRPVAEWVQFADPFPAWDVE